MTVALDLAGGVTPAMVKSLRRIAAKGEVNWSSLWRTSTYGHPWTINALARRGLIYDRHYLRNGDDWEVWALTDLGKSKLAPTPSETQP